MKIYLPPRPSGRPFKSVYTFLKYYFTCLPKEYRGGFPMSYSDAECTVLQCKKGAYRSFDELVMICQTYFPDCTPEDVAKTLNKLFPKIKCSLYFCEDIRKVVVSIHDRDNPTIYDSIDEHEWDENGKGYYTPNMIKALIEQ